MRIKNEMIKRLRIQEIQPIRPRTKAAINEKKF